jgi:adenosylhomocysteine nucleosidase
VIKRNAILVVSGLAAEARIAAGDGIVTLAGGGDSLSLAQQLRALERTTIAGVVSFGVAGALDPALRPGDIVAATSIITMDESYAVSAAHRERWAPSLALSRRAVRDGAIAGVDAPVLGPEAKAELRARTGAAAVDMESHVAAAFAHEHGLPFSALRIISDGANRVLPPVAGQAMRADGGIDLAAVLASLARQPRQLPALLGTAIDAATAFIALRSVSRRLGHGFGLGHV